MPGICPNCATEIPSGGRKNASPWCPSCHHPLVAARSENGRDSCESDRIFQPPEKDSGPISVAAGVDEKFSVERASSEENADTSAKRQSMERLLPPKFRVSDPDFPDLYKDHSVLLPDGKGGITSVKRNVVKVQHKGQTIELIALPPEEQRRRRRFWNCFWIVVGVVFLGFLLSMI